MRKLLLISSVLLALSAITGCKSKPADEDRVDPAAGPAAPAPAPTPAPGGGDAVAKAKEIYATRCTPCHGPAGAGDGAASAGLTPKPRNFQDPTWHPTVDDAYIEKIIKFGGTAVGKSPAMPGNPDLNDPAVIAELRSVVRGFKK